MAINYLTGDRDQQFLLPPDMREWLAEDHLVWFLLDVVDRFDLSEFERRSADARGRRAYDPAVLVAVLIYAYCVGERSSRRIERRCHEDVALRVAARNLAPDHTTLSRFVKDNADAFDALFVQVLALAAQAGLGKVGAIFVDGTKMPADASPLAGRTREQIENEVRRITTEARETDTAEDELLGAARGDELPDELGDPRRRATRLDQALRELEEIEAVRARRTDSKARKPPRANVTDPESRTVKGPRGFFFGYNAQAAVTGDGLIVAADVTQDTVDNAQFVPVVELAQDHLDDAGMAQPTDAVADNGYWSPGNASSDRLADDKTGADGSTLSRPRPKPLIAPPRSKTRPKANPDQPIPEDAGELQRMEHRLAQPDTKALYKLRSSTIEPVFGQIKANRGITRFRRRGLAAARNEWRLIATTHNLLKIWRITQTHASI